MIFDDRAKKFLDHPDTDDEIKACFEDLKVLGKADFKQLLKWRFKMIRMVQKEQREQRAREKSEGKNNQEIKADDSKEKEEKKKKIPLDFQKSNLKRLDWLRKKNKREKKN